MPQITTFLDYGHGGSDSGATAFGLKEKDMNLVTGEACKKELERHGVKVYTARDTDITMSLQARTDKANKTNASTYVSIHHNAGGGDRGEYIHSIFGNEGEKLAECVGEEMLKILGQQKKVYDKKGINGDYYHVIRATKMTSIIVEVCFIDNKTDVQIADTVEEQRRNGVVIAHGILKYYGIAIKSNNNTTVNKPSTPTAPNSNTNTIYRVVCGSFTARKYAESVQANLKKDGFDTFLDAYKKDGMDYLRVVCGSFKNKAKAEERKQHLMNKGYKPFIAIYNGDVEQKPSKPTTTVPTVPTNGDREVQRYKENGKCTITTSSGIKFRDKPSTTTGKVQGTYSKGENVYYDLVVITDNYVWVSWTSAKTGARRYMPIKDRKKNERWANCV